MSQAEFVIPMSNLLALPNEILTFIIKDIFLSGERDQKQIVQSITLIRPDHHAILLTCHHLYKVGIQHYHESTELFVKRNGLKTLGPLGWAGNKTSAPVITADSFLDTKVILSTPELFSNLKYLNWDMTDPLKLYQGNYLFRVHHRIPCETLRLEPIKMFTTKLESCFHCQQEFSICEGFSRMLTHCRLLRARIFQVEVKFQVYCLHVQCPLRPGIKHEFQANYHLKITHVETLEIDGRPQWWMNTFDDEFGDYNSYNDQSDCDCQAKFMGSETVEV